MIKIGAFWKREKEDGSVYFSGQIDFPASLILDQNTRIFLFKNRSESQKSPVLDLLIAKDTRSQNNGVRPEQEQEYDDDIPF